MRSSGNEVLVRFVTNNKIPSKGFQANYYSVCIFYLIEIY